MAIWSVLCPSNSATVRRCTPAITSLLAKVWHLQCQVTTLDLRLFERAGKPATRSLERLAGEGRPASLSSSSSAVQFLQGGDCDRMRGKIQSTQT
jgi:hypothetical protein